VSTHLGLTKKNHRTIITGIQGKAKKPSTHIAEFKAGIMNPSKTIRETAILVDEITHNMPKASIPAATGWEVTKGLQLDDPNFYESSGIDLLIGMDLMSQVLMSGITTCLDTEPQAFRTAFGWAIDESYSGKPTQQAPILRVQCETNAHLDHLLEKFWQMEAVPVSRSQLTPDEQEIIKVFN